MYLILKDINEAAEGPKRGDRARGGERAMETIVTRPGNLCITLRESAPVLRVAEDGVREFPMRESFIDALLSWHHLERGQLSKASNETAVSFFNDLLLAIADERVTLIIKDGDAHAIAESSGAADG